MSILGLGLIDGFLILAATFSVFWGLRKTSAPSFRSVAFGLLAVLTLHFLIAGFRWQILPAYLALFLTMLSYSAQRRWIRFTIFPFVALLLCLSVLASWAFPLFRVPAPTLDYDVGTGMVFLTDGSRDEGYTDIEGDYRQLALKIWYPSKHMNSGPVVPGNDRRAG